MPAWQRTLTQIRSAAGEQYRRSKRRGYLKVLVGPSFSIYPPSFAFDSLLASALMMRGVRVISLWCDGIQEEECNVFGGDWLGSQSFKSACRSCQRQSLRLLESDPVDSKLPLSSFLRENTNVLQITGAEVLSGEEWAAYSVGGLPLGDWASQILRNNWTTDRLSDIPRQDQLMRNQVRNLLKLFDVYGRAIDHIRPDRILSNDSHYGMWATLEGLAVERSIPFYSHWPTSGSRIAVRRNGAAMDLDFSEPWTNFRNLPLPEKVQESVRRWLARNPGSGGSFISASTRSTLASSDNTPQPTIEDPPDSDDNQHPVCLLAANAIWDLAALDRQIVFKDMIDWISQTVQWFANQPELLLVIRPHPLEVDPALPRTRRRVVDGLRETWQHLPGNVLLDDSRDFPASQWFNNSRVCVVNTSTVGFEAAASGLPVLTTGHSAYRGLGFTDDPSSPDEYFDLLGQYLLGTALPTRPERIQLAERFTALQQFCYYMKHGLFDADWVNAPTLHVRDISDLAPGRNEILDFIVDSIVEGLPITDAARWPPFSP